MPFVSEKRKFLWAKYPDIAKKFAEHSNDLEMGTEVELEHRDLIKKMLIDAGKNPSEEMIRMVAAEIAKVHIEEDPEYYEKLAEIENSPAMDFHKKVHDVLYRVPIGHVWIKTSQGMFEVETARETLAAQLKSELEKDSTISSVWCDGKFVRGKIK